MLAVYNTHWQGFTSLFHYTVSGRVGSLKPPVRACVLYDEVMINLLAIIKVALICNDHRMLGACLLMGESRRSFG